MTFAIIKPDSTVTPPVVDEPTITTAFINGMKADNIKTLHDAATTANLGGQYIERLFIQLKQELLTMSFQADQKAYTKLVIEGKTVTTAKAEVIAELNAMGYHFDANDIFQYKVEVYSSLLNWKNYIMSLTASP